MTKILLSCIFLFNQTSLDIWWDHKMYLLFTYTFLTINWTVAMYHVSFCFILKFSMRFRNSPFFLFLLVWVETRVPWASLQSDSCDVSGPKIMTLTNLENWQKFKRLCQTIQMQFSLKTKQRPSKRKGHIKVISLCCFPHISRKLLHFPSTQKLH